MARRTFARRASLSRLVLELLLHLNAEEHLIAFRSAGLSADRVGLTHVLVAEGEARRVAIDHITDLRVDGGPSFPTVGLGCRLLDAHERLELPHARVWREIAGQRKVRDLLVLRITRIGKEGALHVEH